MRMKDDRYPGEKCQECPDEVKDEQKIDEGAESVDDEPDADGGLEDAEEHEPDAARKERRNCGHEVGYGVIAGDLQQAEPDEDECERPAQQYNELVLVQGLCERHFLHVCIVSREAANRCAYQPRSAGVEESARRPEASCTSVRARISSLYIVR